MNEKKLFIFGDSIAYGHSDYKNGGWANILKTNLMNKQDDFYTIFNLSVSGDTTSDILNRFDNEINVRFCSTDDINVIFAIGINDTQNINNKDRVSIETFKDNINNLIKKARKYTNNFMFLGLTNVDESKVTPLPWNPMKCYLNKKIIIFDNELEGICNNKNIKYIKLYDTLNIDDLDDGLHPNSNGHRKIYESITNKNLF